MHIKVTTLQEGYASRLPAERVRLIYCQSLHPKVEGLCTLKSQRCGKDAPAGFLLSVFG